MTLGYVALLAAILAAQLVLPIRFGFIPLLVAACHLGNTEVIPELTAVRAVIIVGLMRAVMGGKIAWSFKSSIDKIFVFFLVAMISSSFGHVPDQWSPHPFANRVGLALNLVGTYLYGRTYLTDFKSFLRFGKSLCIILIPLAIIMLTEMRSGRNFYYFLGSGSFSAATREDKIRAQGPFRGANTAGCVGATSLPFAFLFWQQRKKVAALLAISACLGVTIACNSSGPLAAVAVSILACLLWPWRSRIRTFLWVLLLVATAYGIYKGRGPWYIMARIDLVGGSTGYYRAELIDAGVKHLNEWWLWGTDHTRHWMPSGVSWSPNHTDMTNYYLHLGVIGGLSLTLSLFAILFKCFQMIGRRMKEMRQASDPDEVILWCAGTAMAAHAISFIAISYYDQMSVFFYLLVAAIPGMVANADNIPAPTIPEILPTPLDHLPKQALRYYS